MINKKEGFVIGLVILLITFSLCIMKNFLEDWNYVLGILLAVSVIVLVSIFTKKMIAYLLDTDIEMKIWEVQRYGPGQDQHLKKPFPFGAFLPILSIIFLFPFKNLVWMASLVFDIKPRIYRGAKRYGLYAFSDVTEYHIGLIAASGIFMNLILAVLGYFLGFPTFSRLNIYFALFNILPISDLDGNKIFFGNPVLWSFLVSLVLIGILFSIFII